MRRVPGCTIIPSGTVMRSILLGEPSCSTTTAPMIIIPLSGRRPSLPVKQTCLASAASPFAQTLVHGEYISCGTSLPAGAAACAPAAGGAVGCGAALGCACAFGAGGAGALGAGAGACAPASVGAASSISITANARAEGRADAIQALMTNPLRSSPRSKSQLRSSQERRPLQIVKAVPDAEVRLAPRGPPDAAGIKHVTASRKSAYNAKLAPLPQRQPQPRFLAQVQGLPRRRLLAFEFPARFLGALLQIVLQLLLLLLEHFRIRRRPVIGLAEIVERQHQRDHLAVAVHALHRQALAFLELSDQLSARLVVRHAAIGEADDIRRVHRLALIDDDPRALGQHHAERQCDAKDLLGVCPLGLD